MKWIQCQTDNNLKDRRVNQGCFKSCNHSLVLEPTSMGKLKMIDLFLARAIADLSVNQTLKFTPEQFLYFFARRLKKKTFYLQDIFSTVREILRRNPNLVDVRAQNSPLILLQPNF